MSIRSNPDQPQDELFRSRLENMIDMNHPLVKLGQGIDWEVVGVAKSLRRFYMLGLALIRRCEIPQKVKYWH